MFWFFTIVSLLAGVVAMAMALSSWRQHGRLLPLPRRALILSSICFVITIAHLALTS